MRRVVGKAAAHPRGTPRRGRRSRSGGRGTGSAAGGLLEVGRDVLRALLLELGLDLVAGADAMVLELVERHLVLDGEVDALAALRVLERGDRGVAVRREVDLRDDAEQLLLGAGHRAGGEGEGDGEGQRGSELLHVRSPGVVVSDRSGVVRRPRSGLTATWRARSWWSRRVPGRGAARFARPRLTRRPRARLRGRRSRPAGGAATSRA